MNSCRLFPPRPLRRLALACAALLASASAVSAALFPDEYPTAKPEEHGLLTEKLDAIWQQLEPRKTNVFVVVRNDRIVYERYANGYSRTKPHYTASLAKAVVAGLSLMFAVDDGLIKPDDPVSKYVPQWRDVPLKKDITIAQLATHTSGLEDADQPGVKHRERSGWKGQFWRNEAVPNDPFTTSRDFAPVMEPPGTAARYSNPGIAMLTYAVTAALRNSPHSDIRSLLRERLMKPLGIPDEEFKIGYNHPSEIDGLTLYGSWGGAEISANAAARIGRLLLHKGDWDETQVFSQQIIATATKSVGLPNHSGLSWWTNIRPDFTRVFPTAPRDTFWGLGAGGQLLMVIPSLNMVVIRHGNAMADEDLLASIRKFIVAPLMQAFAPQSSAPYPQSNVIKRITWAPADTIVRRAPGGDNWPLTWADDGEMYTAYGDGNGFEPFVPEKLSLGFAKISGGPENFTGENIRSATGESIGDDRRGKKGSSMLMVDGVLYMWARNAGNSQLAWSTDHAKTWTWCDWKFTESFGFPVFLNFGRNYAGARDDYVYIYSTDADSAYVRADQLVLARVHKNWIRDRDAYEFFVRVDDQNRPVWSRNIKDRGGVFRNPGSVYRTQATYHPVLKRYLLNVIDRGTDTRYSGGFGVYDAPTPWGPWTTAFFTDNWDVGPGEMNSFPTKWMSADGKTAWLVFSGDDHFSVRKATFEFDEPLAARRPPESAAAKLPVIPGASGFGIYTPAGRGGEVIRVTNLNDSGRGSLRAALSASGPRVIVFEVSGNITLSEHLVIRNPYVTIAGQTAPSPGITIRGAGIVVVTHDVLIQHLRVRPGDDPNGPNPENRDAICIGTVPNSPTYNVVIDHVSLSWAIDEVFSTWSRPDAWLSDVTLRDSLIYEPLQTPLHPMGPQGSSGVLIGRFCERVAIVGNLMTFIDHRNPLARDDVKDVVVVNNFVHKPAEWTHSKISVGSRGEFDFPLRVSIVGNVYEPKTPEPHNRNFISVNKNAPTETKLYLADNLSPLASGDDPWSRDLVAVEGRPVSAVRVDTPPVWPDNLKPIPAHEVEAHVLKYAGARPADRDEADQRVIRMTRAREYQAPFAEISTVGGYPQLAENRHRLALPDNPNGDDDGDGYTNLEEWLHAQAAIVEGRAPAQ